MTSRKGINNFFKEKSQEQKCQKKKWEINNSFVILSYFHSILQYTVYFDFFKTRNLKNHRGKKVYF